MPAIGACCRRCGAPLPCSLDACVECRGRSLSFDRAWAPFAYGGAARAVVLGLKARDLHGGTDYMAGAIARRAPPGLLDGVLVPVPAHRERLRRHGQNQAQALARVLGRVTRLAVHDVLARRPGAPRQVGLRRAARQVNARGWIAVTRPIPPGTRAVLVDDVYTTGSTIDACAAALRGAGAGPVAAVCFARTVRAAPPVALKVGGA
jgi:predicted amidophosphoribosyltransferase